MKNNSFRMALQMEELGLRTKTTRNAPDKSKPGLAPWAGEAPKVLILGTLPGDESLMTGQYYQNPTNRFWTIIHTLFGGLPNDKSKEFLFQHKIALWDCLKSAQRKGSTDKRIVRGSEIPNDVFEFLQEYSTIKYIVLNGKSKTKRYFYKYFKELYKSYEIIVLPQTSKLNESGKYKISYEEKLSKWRILKEIADAQP